MAAPPGSPTDQYRGQQGIGPITQSADPVVVDWIKRAAKATGADPNVLLATALQESGARRGQVGDQGTSFGPFQHHRQGALGAHSPAWANSYPATLERAQQFSKGQIHHGKGAAAIQRPQDRSLYARGVDSHMEQARRIIARDMQTAAADAASKPHAPKPGGSPSALPTQADEGNIAGADLMGVLMSNAKIGDLPGASTPSASPEQSALNSNAAIAGVTAPTLPVPFGAAPTPATTVPAAKPRVKPTAVAPRRAGRVTTLKNPKLIGQPHQGTHTLGNWESDNAVDIAMPARTPIYAAADGVIGSQIGSLGSKNPRFAGERLHLKIAGNELYYQHLQKIVVKAGQRVKAGQILGYSGALNHLHLGSKNGAPGRYA